MTNKPQAPGARRPLLRAAIIAALCAAAFVVAAAAWRWLSPEDGEFALAEVPMPLGERISAEMGVACKTDPSASVQSYPIFVSAAPLYGGFPLQTGVRDGKRFTTIWFALDESKGTGTGYDILYFDANGNLDLTDDPVSNVTLMDASGATFGHVTVAAGIAGDGYPGGLDLLPRSGSIGLGSPVAWSTVMYFSPGKVRQGRIRMGGRPYLATLVPSLDARGNYDDRRTQVRLESLGRRLNLLGFHFGPSSDDGLGRSIMSMWQRGSRWYSLETTATGDRLKVSRYRGGFGELKVTDGGRGLEALDVSGALVSDEHIVTLQGSSAFTLPALDYDVDFLVMRADPYQLNISSAARPHEPRRFIHLAPDKPFVLGIPKTVTVTFPWYKEEGVVRPGDSIELGCALGTPDMTIQELYVRQRAVASRAYNFVPLDADVVVTDSTGNEVGRTKTPFCTPIAAEWVIPSDFAPRGGRETLTVTLTCDTGELFGVVTGTREIVVEGPAATTE